ncbi:mono/diheme cytochrome c family protein [Pseudorhizobium tarimense]|uniref:Mono/diheme cytochrome c family protein n=1 Tax=Pseudorhizobium tarimense TaxID=1079109 RepID=A0ABV2HDX3_9HYPH|nr:c-type cytochrome [Pseudorhizobium tarimense]MCJ8521853.1 c-type cytochrome [Pseudorhizobium tarimense]
MDRPEKSAAAAFIGGIVATLAVLGGVPVFVAYSGKYNIAATEEHTSFTRWIFDTTFHNSIQSYADQEAVPELTAAMAAAGAQPYKEMCQHCHAGPGVERDEWAQGMRPRPPHLAEAAAEWRRAKSSGSSSIGAKMTGMTAFSQTHTDKRLWEIAALVKQLPAMTPDEHAVAGEGGSGEDAETTESRGWQSHCRRPLRERFRMAQTARRQVMRKSLLPMREALPRSRV